MKNDAAALDLPIWDELPHYEPRHIRFRELVALDGWTLKLYGVSVGKESISEGLRDAAARVAATILPTAPVASRRYGVGFIIAHESVTTSYVLVCWWDERNEIHQRVFSAPADQPSQMRAHESFAIGCVWELSVTDFERRAWIEEVLRPGGTPTMEAYLSRQLNDDV